MRAEMHLCASKSRKQRKGKEKRELEGGRESVCVVRESGVRERVSE